MNHISVLMNESGDGWAAAVVVTGDDGSSTKHAVGLSRDLYNQLTGGKATPETLVKASFEFLLEREPKESILGQFDLPVISRYFPEFERSIAGRF